KDEYSKMVVQAYKTRNGADKIMYIFASDDFSQAYRRLKYLQQLSEYRQRQAEAIIHTQKSLEKKRLDLEVRRTEKNQVLGEQNEEKLTLNREKQDKEKQLVLLTSQESKFKNELDVAQRKSEELRVAIKRAIERELAARSDESGGGGFNLTPEARELGKSFAANKGKLPWPIDKGEITALFGEQPHAFLKGIKVKNNGVTISTTDGSRARAVFDGEVSKIIILPGAGKVVMIRHGEYISIYTNLKETFVSTGDKVKTKEEIGIVVTDQGKTEFEFQLWKGTVLTDPSYWIYKGR
ncbi:MAG: peptidoglycan DD-metalloendopeptidase family protein, partial [Bacteroidetes bacterium]|nr:peptidoglycan DD-metalloendopeptidase family protein [Bacteroidota bacterium]